MIIQLGYGVVFALIGWIGLCILTLILITPKVSQDLKAYKERAQKAHKVEVATGLSAMMEELSTCSNEATIKKLLEEIRKEATLNTGDGGARGEHAKTVLKWIGGFKVQEHIKDLKKNKKSIQISFDKERKDFNLLIIK